ncbi:WhiB family transcriptional regulator [Nocardioides dongxiaopingii]|uniref:WhiB family transcriptional regulator n=1 Tax=Nocardioides dongxiaopingii TaxID=2576036 RepID=UPI003CCC761C
MWLYVFSASTADACTGLAPAEADHLFFGVTGPHGTGRRRADVARARAPCDGCPVRQACLGEVLAPRVVDD